MGKLKLQFDDDFFRPEERAGYMVTEEKKRLWAVELDLLNEFFRVCKENDIRAYAFAGTLLGAIRHKGFIPWDDDIDVCMNRENYEKLEKIADKAFKYPYFFQTARSDRAFFTNTARLRNTETTGIIPWEYSEKYNGGIFLDCFVMDAVPADEKKFRRQKKELLILQELLRAYKPETSLGQIESDERHRIIKWMVKKIMKYDSLLNLYDKVSMRYNGKSNILALTNTAIFSDKYRCYVEDLNGDEITKFEQIDIPIPQNAHRMLSDIYGNYMDFPSKKQIAEKHDGRIIIDTEIPYTAYFRDHEPNLIWDAINRKQISL